MNTPSTDWKEIISPEEPAKHAKHAKIITILQKKMSKEFGVGRGLHRKQILALRAEFKVLDSIPEYAKVGLFKTAGTFETWIRLSNGSLRVQSDKMPDVRGLAIKVKGIDGESALGGKTKEQDFTLIQHQTFSVLTSDEFIEFIGFAIQGPLGILKFFTKKNGLIGGTLKFGQFLINFSKAFRGFEMENFFSAAPLKFGKYACRVRLKPILTVVDSSGKTIQRKPIPFQGEFADQFEKALNLADVKYEFQVQFYHSDDKTPIEDPTVNWPESVSPYITLAELTIKSSNNSPILDPEFSNILDKDKFDPWNALEDHRPLGEVMRARKVIYFASQQERAKIK
ncbi:catalase [Leptospira sp. GIMC2001]|uniref:catalase n=1 Tax=Leptospira sp. GIMC2001 TaxID=1513297 RepID=UPI00234B3A37|nr:catalase [Leptospira sp. GIMC2001]WCL50065.1 catalase [Leptospira sp. GIMC2001]